MKLKKTKKIDAPAGYYPRVHGVTQSLLSSWLQCRRLAALSLEYSGLKDGGALIYGSIYHAEAAARLLGEDPKVAAAREVDRWKDATAEEVASASEAAALVNALSPIHAKKYATDAEKEWLSVESSFDVVHPDLGVRLRGQEDGVFRASRGGVGLLERKTKSRIDGAIVDLLELDFQLDFYIVAGGLKYGGPVREVVYEVARRPGERRKKDEPLMDYVERVRVRAEKEPGHYFQRHPLKIDGQRRARAAARVESVLVGFLRDYDEGFLYSESTLYNHRNCLASYACPFLGFCAGRGLGGLRRKTAFFEELER